MIYSGRYQKNIEHLRKRMDKIDEAYKLGFVVGFWFSAIFFVLMIAYYGCKLILLSGAWIHNLFGEWNVSDDKMKFATNVVLLIISPTYAAMSFVSFRLRSRILKYFLMVIDMAFMAGCVLMVIYDTGNTLYIGCLVYSALLLWVCINCIIADRDDKRLSKIDGYPHFNPLLIHEEIPLESKIKFRQTKTDEQLYEERLEEYAKVNPYSDMAKVYYEQKEQKRDSDINDWLGEMVGKNKK